MSADLLAAFGTQATTASPTIQDTLQASGRSEHTSQPRLAKPAVTEAQRPPTTQASLWKQDESGTDILFDASADDIAPDDDFGDFEGPETSSQPGQPTASDTGNTDLLGLDDLVVTTEKVAVQTQARSTDVLARNHVGVGNIIDFDDSAVTTKPATTRRETEPEDDWGTFEDVEPDTFTPRTTSGATKAAARHTEVFSADTEEEDDWEAFEDGPVADDAPVMSNTTPTPSRPPPEDSEEDEWDAFEDGPILTSRPISNPATQSQTSKVQPKLLSNTNKPHERPTNIPPPSILLEALPTLYQALAAQSRSNLTTSSITDITAATSLATQIIRTYHTTARILSGRHHRWKRDPHLSQSTRISQSGSTGMKLQSLDRTHTIKEDQDALEAVAAWSRYTHAFNSTILRAKMQRPTTPLSGNMAVRTASGIGVLTAKEVCAVCGLKRNERVVGVDMGAEDVFGEFWVEFWGHRDCCDLWGEVERLLDRR